VRPIWASESDAPLVAYCARNDASSFLVRSHHHDPRDRQHHRLHRRVAGAGRDIRPGAARSRLRRAWQALLRAWLDVFGDVRKRG
jgi:hypothetical protein